MALPHPERPHNPTGLQPGALVDERYRIERLLSRGGMGAVFVAQDLERGVPVALKTILPDLLGDTDLARFEREAQLAAKVDKHDGVVRVHTFGRHRGLPYCVMELVEGESLEALFKRGPVPPARLLPIVEHLARTLQSCHGQGVIHRDLKPANIILRAGDRPKLLDFGLARATSSARLTRTGELLGTPAYMAPEQAIDTARAVDERVDVYGLGAVLFHGLTGQPPWRGSSVSILVALTSREPPSPRAIVPDLPLDLDAVCRTAMARAPEDRYTMAAFREDLERARRGAPVAARPLSRARAWTRRLTSARLRAGLVTVLAALSLLLISLTVGYFAFRLPHQQALAALEGWSAWAAAQVDPWALGTGSAPPPDAVSLANWSERIESARSRLSGAERDQADQALARLALIREVLDVERVATHPLARALRSPDPAAGLGLLRDASGRDAAAARARLYLRLLEPDRSPDPSTARRVLQAPPSGLPTSSLARLRSAGASHLLRAQLRQTLAATSPRSSTSSDEASSLAIPLGSVSEEARRAALLESRPAIEAALAADLRARDPERAIQRVLALGRLLKLPPRPGAVPPEVVALLERSLARGVAEWRSTPDPGQKRRIARTTAGQFEALFAALGVALEVPGIRELVRSLIFYTPSTSDPPQSEAVLVCLRLGWVHSDKVREPMASVGTFRKIGAPRKTLARYPQHMGARFLAAAERESNDEHKDPKRATAFLKELAAVAEGGPGLAPLYQASARLLLSDILMGQIKIQSDEVLTETRAKAAIQARLAQPGALASPFPRMIRRAFQFEAWGLPRALQGPVLERGEAALRARLPQPSTSGRSAVALELAVYLNDYASSLRSFGRLPEALAKARQGQAICEGHLAPYVKPAWELRAIRSEILLSQGKLKAAYQEIEPGLTSPHRLVSEKFVEQAVQVLLRRGRPEDLERARALNREGRARHPESKPLQRQRQRLQQRTER